VFEGSWRSSNPEGADDTVGERRERDIWPEDFEEYGLDVLFDPDAVRSRSTQNDTPSTMPTGTQHAERASIRSGLRDQQLQDDARYATNSADTTPTHGRSDSRSRLKERMLLKNKLRLQIPPARSASSFPPLASRKDSWSNIGTNAPISMQATQHMQLTRKAGVDRKSTKAPTQTSSSAQLCQSPALYTPTPTPTTITHPALLRQTLLHLIQYSKTGSDVALERIWLQMRANILPHPIAYDVRRQLAQCRGLTDDELENAVQERLEDLDRMRRWVEKWREK
jgi:hypothetical protein